MIINSFSTLFHSQRIQIVNLLLVVGMVLTAYLTAFGQKMAIPQYGAYVGGTAEDQFLKAKIDSEKNIIIVGKTSSTNMASIGSFQDQNAGGSDCFIRKIDSTGTIIWTTYFGGETSEDPKDFVIDSLDNIYLVGSTSSFSNIATPTAHQTSRLGNSDGFIVKFNSNGNRVWASYVGGMGNNDQLNAICVKNQNEIIVGGMTNSNGDIVTPGCFQSTYWGAVDGYISIFDSSGIYLYGSYIGGGGADEILDIAVSKLDQSIIIAGATQSTNNISTLGGGGGGFIKKFDNNLSQLFGLYYGGANIVEVTAVEIDNANNILIGGYTISPTLSTQNSYQENMIGSGDAFLTKFSPNGSLIWSTYIGGEDGNDDISDLEIDSENHIYLLGDTYSNNFISTNISSNGGLRDLYLMKFDENGNRIYGQFFGGYDFEEVGSLAKMGNEIVVAGHTNSIGLFDPYFPASSNFNGGLTDGFVLRLSEPIIDGFVYYDFNNDCLNNEVGVRDYKLVIEPMGFIIQTDTTGYFHFVNDENQPVTRISIDTTNIHLLYNCGNSIDITSQTPTSVDFGISYTNACSKPDISILAQTLRSCFSNQIVRVKLCNQSNATGILSDTYVDIELDSKQSLTSANFPFVTIQNNLYRIETGDLNPGQCIDIVLSTQVSCLASPGQSLCMSATLYPIENCSLDSIPSVQIITTTSNDSGTLVGLPEPCTLPWDQSSLSVDGWCQNDTIYFTITNTGELGGGDMECYSPLWVTVDGVVTFTDSIMIQGGQTITYSFPGDGATWILNAAQHPLHPGNSNPNAHVEACGDLSNWTPDLVNDFPQDDADPVVDIYCGVVTGSYDPNDKTGYPNGVTDQYYIQPNQQLQYVIRFQNTGTDTAFTVVIRDTLDTDLNIFTVTSGVSSHAYEFRMYGPRVLEWTFNNINLPDSTVDLEGSNGFVTFHVEQVPDLAPGTEITNDADIYFDFNDPITTNTTMHRIYEGFVSVASLEMMSKEEAGIIVYPNPNNGEFTIVLENNSASNYSIFDQQGRVVKTGFLEGQKTTIDLELQNGMYYLMVDDGVVKVQVKE